MNLQEIIIQPVQPGEQKHFQSLMVTHHYLGALPKIGHTLWYVASYRNEWLALLSFSAAAWKCAARDQWIGWSYRYQYDRLHLIANNSRFLILPGHHYPNLASRVLALDDCQDSCPIFYATFSLTSCSSVSDFSGFNQTSLTGSQFRV
ncbi:Druantia anti-phage system protein DruA, partial [Thiolapillus sp.]|uniref:Druantia anti-phage system protein DruA n=1 Tax=Thiolapillus sp. TaxID=2017437 RepID=UPI003AF93BD2